MNSVLLEHQADALRGQGDLEAAAVLYEELLSLQPDHIKADRLTCSLTGRSSRLAAVPGGLKTAPFVIVRDFLPDELHNALLSFMISKADEFEPAATTKGIRLDYRHSWIHPGGLECIARRPRYDFLTSVKVCWIRQRGRMRIPEFETSISEAHILMYKDGNFFATHRDAGSPNNTRRVTFSYNLHRVPKPFTGGDLLLYDTYFWPGGVVAPAPLRFAKTYTRIVARDNQLVLFPSEFYHEVTTVSSAGNSAADARFVINGWLDVPPENGTLEFMSHTSY